MCVTIFFVTCFFFVCVCVCERVVCHSVVCERVVCDNVVCDRAGGAGRTVDRSAQQKKQEPHAQRCGKKKHNNPPLPIVISTINHT